MDEVCWRAGGNGDGEPAWTETGVGACTVGATRTILGMAVNFSLTSRVSWMPWPKIASIFLVTRPVTSCGGPLLFWLSAQLNMPCPTKGVSGSE